tara:strand:- start:376 stop:489 length:114 start_codon:yes stop_codon:yes gene_type:complete
MIRGSITIPEEVISKIEGRILVSDRPADFPYLMASQI